MSSRKCRVTLVSSFLVAVLCAGCFSAPLPPLDYPPEVKRLLELAERPMGLDVRSVDTEASVGHQFLFFLMPVTRIRTPAIADSVTGQLVLDGAARGYRLSRAPSAHTLAVEITDIRVNGYDFVFVRRPSASITLRGVVSGQTNRMCTVTGEHSSFEPLAFEKELNRAVRKALEAASKQLLDCLRL